MTRGNLILTMTPSLFGQPQTTKGLRAARACSDSITTWAEVWPESPGMGGSENPAARKMFRRYVARAL